MCLLYGAEKLPVSDRVVLFFLCRRCQKQMFFYEACSPVRCVLLPAKNLNMFTTFVILAKGILFGHSTYCRSLFHLHTAPSANVVHLPLLVVAMNRGHHGPKLSMLRISLFLAGGVFVCFRLVGGLD